MNSQNSSIEAGTPVVSNHSGKYLTFALSQERYGMEILKVQEIIGVPAITRVPRSPDYMKGVINLRGRIIPVIDLRLKFSMEPVNYDEKTCIIVVNISKGAQKVALGVIVDTVLEVIHFDQKDIEPAPDYGSSIATNFILGMGRKEGEALNILVDIERSLSCSETETLVAAGA